MVRSNPGSTPGSFGTRGGCPEALCGWSPLGRRSSHETTSRGSGPGVTDARCSGGDAVTTIDQRSLPFLALEYCKGCGRCIASCTKDCIALGTEIHPVTGLVPITLDLTRCNRCGLCIDACPEPFGLRPQGEEAAFALLDPALLGGPRPYDAPTPGARARRHRRPARTLAARRQGHVRGGRRCSSCRMPARLRLPDHAVHGGGRADGEGPTALDGVFVQAVSEVATVNMMYGAGGAGKRCMTFTSSPGFSLMLEGISYMIGAEVPAVFVNIMRGGPGLGNIGPAQADIKLACRGLGHGNTHAIVLVPATPQEMLDSAMLSFELAFKYRNPVVILGDGYLGQMTGKVRLPDRMVVPGIPEWAVYGDHSHRGNLICSIELSELELERHDQALDEKYARMAAEEQRADLHHCDDVDVVIVACNTPAQLAKGAVKELRDHGLRVGLFRPITLWPFPIDALLGVIDGARHIVVVEASEGQLEDEVRLALSHAEVHAPPISHVRRQGGILPSQAEIVERVLSLEGGALDAVVGLLSPVRTSRSCDGDQGACDHLLSRLRSRTRVEVPRRGDRRARRPGPHGARVARGVLGVLLTTTSTSATPRPRTAGHPPSPSATRPPIRIRSSSPIRAMGTWRRSDWPRSSAPPSWASR